MPPSSVSTDSLATPQQQSYQGKKLRLAFIGCGAWLAYNLIQAWLERRRSGAQVVGPVFVSGFGE